MVDRSLVLVVPVALALVVAALPLTSLSAGPLGPTEAAWLTPAAQFPEDALDASATCPGLEVGVAVRDVTPGVRLADGTYDLWMEPYDDTNGNGVYDAPNPLAPGDHFDPFTDENLNGKWDGPFMAGYGHRIAGNEYYVAQGVHDPIWARALAIRCGAVLLGLASVDVVGLFQHEVWDIRSRVADVGFDHVVVASTHTHDAIDTMGLWGPNEVTDGKDPRTNEHVKAQAAAALRAAAAVMHPVTVKAGFARTQDPAIVEFAGYVQTDLRDPFVVDDLVLAAQFLRLDGTTLATLVNWSPHPETLAGTRSEVSADFPDKLRRAIESEGATVGGVTLPALGGTAVYFSGAVGGMMTTLGARVFDEAGDPVPDRSYAKAERIGEVAAFAAMRGLAQGTTGSVDGLRVQVREVTFPIDNPFLAALNTIGLFEHPVALGPAHVPALDPVLGLVAPVPFIRAELNVIALSAGGLPFVQIVTVPGELLPEIAVGDYLATAPDATLETCFAYNALKYAVNGNREGKIDPATGVPTPGFERKIAAHAEIPTEPVLRDHMSSEHNFLFGLANDELGYVVPASDFIAAVAAWPYIGDEELGVYLDGTDRCGDGDHYEETVSASSIMAPVFANNLVHMLDPTFVPPAYPASMGGVLGNPTDVGGLLEGEPTGVWVDTSGSNGYEAEEDVHVGLSLPSYVSGAWGFVDHDGRDQGQEPTEDTRGLWIDVNGNEQYDAGDGVIFADYWAFHG